MPLAQNALALHTWSLDTTPLATLLSIARATGWDAVELRRIDFDRAAAAGQSEAEVLDLVAQSGLPVAAVGVEFGWMFAEGTERERLEGVFERSCAAAAALGARVVMSPVDRGVGDVAVAADSVRRVGDIAQRYGVRLALEFNSQVDQFCTLDAVREVLALARQPACGLLLDTYHLQRSGLGFADVALDEIAYVQYSDVAGEGLRAGYTLDRLPPGQGVIDFPSVFGLLDEKGYAGPLSYEGPNPAAWARDPTEVAREVRDATRAVVGQPPVETTAG